MEQPKLYYYMSESHHYLISAIDKNNYGIFDLCTIRYTEDRWPTLKEAIEGSKKYYKNLKIFNTYKELFEYMLYLENELYEFSDIFGEKDLVERESFHEKKAKEFVDKNLLGKKY